MDRASDIRALQREQRDAVDSVQHNSQHCRKILRRYVFRGRYDQHDLHDHVHSVYISC